MEKKEMWPQVQALATGLAAELRTVLDQEHELAQAVQKAQWGLVQFRGKHPELLFLAALRLAREVLERPAAGVLRCQGENEGDIPCFAEARRDRSGQLPEGWVTRHFSCGDDDPDAVFCPDHAGQARSGGRCALHDD